MDAEIRELQRKNDPSWRFKAQRAGLRIPFQIGDVILIGEAYDFRGKVYSSSWGGEKCPVLAVIVELEKWNHTEDPKIIAKVLPKKFSLKHRSMCNSKNSIATSRAITLVDKYEDSNQKLP